MSIKHVNFVDLLRLGEGRYDVAEQGLYSVFLGSEYLGTPESRQGNYIFKNRGDIDLEWTTRSRI